jgi:transaldolase
MDPTFAKSLPFKPHNQTSNQLLVNEQMSIPENREMFLQAVKEYKEKGWEAVLDRIVCSPHTHPSFSPHQIKTS